MKTEKTYCTSTSAADTCPSASAAEYAPAANPSASRPANQPATHFHKTGTPPPAPHSCPTDVTPSAASGPSATEIKRLKQNIAILKSQMRLDEIADDGYYISRRYQEDARRLGELECRLSALCCTATHLSS